MTRLAFLGDKKGKREPHSPIFVSLWLIGL